MSEAKKPPALKLGKLPDRKPVKMTVTLSAELAAKLRAYAVAYREAYGEAENVADLVPFMLAAFIDADRTFTKALMTGRARGAMDDDARDGGDSSPRGRARTAPA